nr:PREDICTED: uncharacterized protein LOC103993628 [Musa acuminata subsp. malaccensis]
MTSVESNSEDSSAKNSRKDPGWKYNYLKDPKDPNVVTCIFCEKTTGGGIFHAKQHQVGNLKNVSACKMCPPDVKEELLAYMNDKKIQRNESYEISPEDDIQYLTDDDEGVDHSENVNASGKRISHKKGKEVMISKKTKKGPMDLYMFQESKKVIRGQKGAKLIQTGINDDCDEEIRARTIQHIARFFYQAGIPINACHLDSFKEMIEAIGRYGPKLRPPSYHELRCPLLKKELEYTNDLLKGHKNTWVKHGCSIMSDAWTDMRQKSIINFMVNCSLGTMFVKSIYASSFIRSGEKTFELLDKFVEEIGEQNVIQVITDNGSNYVLAGELLQAKREHLYWTPCAAHCIDLMLEDIGKISYIKMTLERAIFLVGFLYSHTGTLNMMRGFTSKKELVRYGVTRFTTSFLTLQSVYRQKHNLINMLTSNKWVSSKWAKDAKGKRASDIISMSFFWNQIVYTLKVMSPLVRVLRLIYNEKKPAMGYIYKAMDRAKETIQKSFGGNEEKYKHIFAIIDKRWECQLHHPLHAAGYYLNSEFFYKDSSIKFNVEVVSGLYQCIARLVPDIEIQDKIINELSLYKNAEGLFGNPMAIRSRTTLSPAEWWNLFGNSTPNLQQLAIKILSLTCSTIGCERDFSIFENIHAQRRNRLEHQRLHDLVYIKYNQALKARYNLQNGIDPISSQDIDDSNEWLVGEAGANLQNVEDEFIFEDNNLTCGDVTRVSGVGELRTCTRQLTKAKLSARALNSSLVIVEEEDNYFDEAEPKEYKSTEEEEEDDDKFKNDEVNYDDY